MRTSQRPALRKQISCASDAGSSTVNRAIGGGTLRKQLSVDQVTTTTTTTTLGGRTLVKKRGGDVKTQPAAATDSVHSTAEHQRINLNIFLSPNSVRQSSLDGGDSSDSAAASAVGGALATPKTSSVAASVQPALTSAADRRAAFQSNGSKTLGGGGGGSSIDRTRYAPAMHVSGTTKPPLIRAQSAPIRPALDANAPNKRRLPRRRRPPSANAQRDRSLDASAVLGDSRDGRAFALDNLAEGDETTSVSLRSRSALGARNDVITLVSLLVSSSSSSLSGGSDTERDVDGDGADDDKNDGPATGRAPTLRKTGKSVSFQESTLADGVAYLRPDFPLVLRRGSIAPLAARIRANRPPTAPPGSLFVRGLSNVDDGECSRAPTAYLPISSAVSNMPAIQVEGVVASPESNSRSAKNTINNTSTALNIDYPVFCRSAKERECWVLFQKMAQKGVSVSYETILRGLLTPTELRAVLKQREAAAAAQQQLAELNDDRDAKAVVSSTSSASVRCS